MATNPVAVRVDAGHTNLPLPGAPVEFSRERVQYSRRCVAWPFKLYALPTVDDLSQYPFS